MNKRIIVHGAMVYGCVDCGVKFIMFLEKGLEEKGCKDTKPVPFSIRCPFCSGFHARDISGYLPLPGFKEHELIDGESYFANLPDKDCGTPMYAARQRKFGVHQAGKVIDE